MSHGFLFACEEQGNRFDGLPDGGGHGGLHALRNQVRDQLAHDNVVVHDGDDAAPVIAVAIGLTEDRVGLDQV